MEKYSWLFFIENSIVHCRLGIIRHSIIAPVMMPVINFSTETLTKHLMFGRGSKMSGISAGDDFEIEEKDERKKRFNEYKLDIKLKELIEEFVKENPECAKDIVQLAYPELKKQLIEAVKGPESGKTNVITELFGITEAKANPFVGQLAQRIAVWGGGALISLLVVDKTSETLQNIEFEKDNSLPLSISETNEDETGICKESHPYLLEVDRFTTKESWMQKPNVSFKDKELLKGVEVYGWNVVQVGFDKRGALRVDTELPGGEAAARECFRNLTGVEVPLIIENGRFEFTTSKGISVQFRQLGSSGHSKIDIDSRYSSSLHKFIEKITFKNL